MFGSWHSSENPLHLTLELRYIMAKRRYYTDCVLYPQCESLKELVRDIPKDLVLTRTVVLQKGAEPICTKCPDFEPKSHRL